MVFAEMHSKKKAGMPDRIINNTMSRQPFATFTQVQGRLVLVCYDFKVQGRLTWICFGFKVQGLTRPIPS